MLAHDCWLDTLRFLGRCDLDTVELLNKGAHSMILSDKCLSSLRRYVEEVTFENGVCSLKGSKELRCGMFC